MKPLGFIDYNHLQMHAYAVLSDSGTISGVVDFVSVPWTYVSLTPLKPWKKPVMMTECIRTHHSNERVKTSDVQIAIFASSPTTACPMSARSTTHHPLVYRLWREWWENEKCKTTHWKKLSALSYQFVPAMNQESCQFSVVSIFFVPKKNS